MSKHSTITTSVVGRLLAALAQRCEVLSINFHRSMGSNMTVELTEAETSKRMSGRVAVYPNLQPNAPPLHIDIGSCSFDVSSADDLEGIDALKSDQAFSACFIGRAA